MTSGDDPYGRIDDKEKNFSQSQIAQIKAYKCRRITAYKNIKGPIQKSFVVWDFDFYEFLHQFSSSLNFDP